MFDDELREDFDYIANNVPILFKYMNFETCMKTVSNSQMVFKNPSIFNDPYDCYLGLIKFDYIPPSYNKYLISKYYTHLNRTKRKQLLKSNKKISDSEFLKLQRDIFLPSASSKFGVTCFSQESNNLLMWSHYAESHTGVCIGFDREILYRSFKKIPINELALLRVRYTDKLEPVEYFKETKKAIINLFRIKSIDWKYEKEIRMISTEIELNNDKLFFAPFDNESIKFIYLGSKINPEHEKSLIEICKLKYPNAQLSKMQMDNKSFNMIAEETNM